MAEKEPKKPGATEKAPEAVREPRAAKPKDTVTMIFPKTTMLNVGGRDHLQFKAGANEVPIALADHWYLKASGVKPYEG